MKIIHCADIHLGSQMDAHLPYEKVQTRRAEVRNTFARLVEYAKREGVFHILLSGDIFDGERPLKKDREFFYNLVSASSEITFYYLRGNHDIKESSAETLENLKLFSDRWQSYDAGECLISGVEITEGNCTSLYSGVPSCGGKLNIVMLHGQISQTASINNISIPALSDKSIDYLALGHIHSYDEGRLGERGIYVYPGCLEGRGFDECGEKGFVLLDTASGRLTHTFIPFAGRIIRSYTVDVTDTDGVYTLFGKIKNLGFSREDMIRLELVGECDYDTSDIEGSLSLMLEPHCFFARIKNKTAKRLNLEDAERELSLRGEFIRVVRSMELSPDDEKEILRLGIGALSGSEI